MARRIRERNRIPRRKDSGVPACLGLAGLGDEVGTGKSGRGEAREDPGVY